MSCGGMFAVKFAARYPDCVSALYLDAPVLNLLSCPADAGQSQSGLWEEFHEATQMTMSELICFREHPIDKLPALVSHGIPVVMVYGKEDVIVPYCENGEVLERYYKEHDGKLLVKMCIRDRSYYDPGGIPVQSQESCSYRFKPQKAGAW